MLHWVVLIWAVVVLVFCVFAVFLILTRRFAHPVSRPVAASTQGPNAQANLARILDLALAQSETDAQFEHVARRLLAEDPAFETETQWVSLLQLMNNYRRDNDPVPATRALARRFLSDFPRLYGTR